MEWMTERDITAEAVPTSSAADLGAHNRAEAEAMAPFKDLDVDIGELAAHVSAATAALLELLARFDEDNGWDLYGGAATFAQWASWRLGMTPAAARDHLRVAHALRGLPHIRAAFARGELSFWQVRAVARIATPETDEMLAGWARGATAAQLERVCGALRAALEGIALERATALYHARRLDLFFDDDGFLQVRGRLCPEDGAVLLEAISAARAELEAECDEDETPSPGDRQAAADALVRVAERALAELPTEPTPPAPRSPSTSTSRPSRETPAPRASSSPAPPSPPRPRADSAATPGSRRSWSGMATPSRWGGVRGGSPAACASPSRRATAAVASPGAGRTGTPTPITSRTGRGAARRHLTTSPCCAVATTASFTRVASR